MITQNCGPKPPRTEYNAPPPPLSPRTYACVPQSVCLFFTPCLNFGWVHSRDRHNILRPETLESLYYLYWITKEDLYREQAWDIFEAFEEHCRVDRGGYAGLEDVTDVSRSFLTGDGASAPRLILPRSS